MADSCCCPERAIFEASEALVTLALIRNDESSGPLIAEAFRLGPEFTFDPAGAKAKALEGSGVERRDCNQGRSMVISIDKRTYVYRSPDRPPSY